MKKDIRHIHMLGIGGTGMGSLAGLLVERGYRVTGTDESIYPPMSNQLNDLGIRPNVGFDPKNLHPRPDLVVIGNVIRRENPEAKAVLDLGVPYLSMPQALSEMFLEGKGSIVVTGTHGKTTTANLIAWLLDYAGAAPGFLVGGVGINFGKGYRYTDGKYFVTEGDEYDTAFFDKGPKFLHYRPNYAIISSIEFDHADIYKDLDQIKSSFSRFAEIIPPDGISVVNADSGEIRGVLQNARCRIVTYGFSEQADYRIIYPDTPHPLTPPQRGGKGIENMQFSITHLGVRHKFTTPMVGRHNIYNAASALALLMELGFETARLAEGLKLFKGVKRRQEVRGVVNSITIIDDFAHHPTAIRETIAAVKERHSGGHVWAVFEPRSNTSRRKIFEKEFAASFRGADKVILADVYKASQIPDEERLNPEAVINSLSGMGVSAYYIPKVPFIVEFIVRNAIPGDVILIMSNGAFDNIHETLINALKKRRFGQVR